MRLKTLGTIRLLLLTLMTAGALSFIGNYTVAEPVADETCLDCHDDIGQTLLHTKHRLSSQMEKPQYNVTCTGCHSGGEVHIEDPSVDNITNPSDLSGRDESEVCTKCHIAHVALDNYGFDAHNVAELNCSSCHRVHGEEQALLLDDRVAFCIACHEQKTSEFHQVSNHPVLQDNITCLSCHRFTKRKEDYQAFEQSGVCRDCHPEQAGPFAYEHHATLAYTPDGSGCLECHQPHGSPNDRLLRQPRENLCRQCHARPAGHITNNQHGFVWSQYEDCMLCHTDVHGSFSNEDLLDPGLPVKFGLDCFQSGCHQLEQ